MFALPLNSITENFYYINDTDKQNQRVIISAPTPHPIVWQISKVANTNPLGIQVITGYQDKWNASTDYIDVDEQASGDRFAMYANYYSSTVVPVEPRDYSSIHLELSCNSNIIKAGGSYKLITANLYEGDLSDITSEITNTTWTCSLNNEDITDDESLVTWLEQDEINKIKIKFKNVHAYYTNILTIRCIAQMDNKEFSGEINLEIRGV